MGCANVWFCMMFHVAKATLNERGVFFYTIDTTRSQVFYFYFLYSLQRVSDISINNLGSRGHMLAPRRQNIVTHTHHKKVCIATHVYML